MDKLIKTISESGSFRAYVLDSTETVRTAQEKHNTLSSSTVALGLVPGFLIKSWPSAF